MQLHTMVMIWALYLLGQLLHILKRAGMAVRSKSNSIRSRIEFIEFSWDALVVRIVLCAGLFAALLTNPHGLTRLFALFGAGITVDIFVDPGTALIFGYFADSVLDWLVSKIPMLQKELPTWDESSHPAP
jgi:hypothetical protein